MKLIHTNSSCLSGSSAALATGREKQLEVNAPLQMLYNQWTRFEEFPRFNEGADEVRQDGLNKLFWKAQIGGRERQQEAEITEHLTVRPVQIDCLSEMIQGK